MNKLLIISFVFLLKFSKLFRCLETPTIATSSLTFVFDVTGSMHDDLLQVIRGATQIYNSTFHRQYAIYDYILIPFADPGKTFEMNLNTRKEKKRKENVEFD